jgi:hypothetical protein
VLAGAEADDVDVDVVDVVGVVDIVGVVDVVGEVDVVGVVDGCVGELDEDGV